ncbi:MAG: hypothetical protein CMJ18_01065 [Phycisphaeraceae bacterium]|nr:hypothetical protein [Phycisphaeraceae bacterium]
MFIYLGDNEDPAVLQAAEALQADLHEVSGVRAPLASVAVCDEHAGFVICTVGRGSARSITARYQVDIGRAEGQRECFVIEQHGDTIVVIGSDTLGTIFGIYHVCEHVLGVDPLRFWTDMPAPRCSLQELWRRARQPVRFGPPAVPLRGWFVNEDDLIRQFDDGETHYEGTPSRHAAGLKSAYLVMNPGVFDGLVSTLLRLKQNLVLPGTYVCPRDSLWRGLLDTAARRGLYTTTQHFQPLGCWPVSFDRYWQQRGTPQTYSWLNNRQVMIDTWHAFAAHLAPCRPVWQVGYRGYDDAPFWESEAGAPEGREARAAVVSEIIHAQVEIARRYDPDPVCTFMLWAENEPLYRSGLIDLPDEVILVFSDYGRTSMMKQSFIEHRPDGHRRTGVYYHLGFWSTGPTNHMGVSAEKIDYNLRLAFEKRATDYLLVNVASVREHLLAGATIADIAARGIETLDWKIAEHDWCARRFGEQEAPQAAALYRSFFDTLPRSPAPSAYERFPKLLHDGTFHQLSAFILELIEHGDMNEHYARDATAARMRSMNLLGVIEEGADQGFDEHGVENLCFDDVDDFLDFAADTGARLVSDMTSLQRRVQDLAPRLSRPGAGRFLRSHVAGQAAMMHLLGEMVRATAEAARCLRRDDPNQARQRLNELVTDIDTLMKAWHDQYEGRFADWPRGELFVAIRPRQEQVRQIAARLAPQP